MTALEHHLWLTRFNRWRIVFLVLMIIAFSGGAVMSRAEPIEMRLMEGVSKGFIALRDSAGDILAEGEVSQLATGAGRVVSRTVLRFKDGSLHDESVTFSQNHILKMLHYQLEQKGPAFPRPIQVSLDGQSGAYTVRHGGSPDGAQLKGTVDLPPDVYNGLTVTVLKNLPAPTERSFHVVAFGPEAVLYRVVVRPVDTDPVKLGGTMTKAVHYQMMPVLKWWTKTLAWLTNKPIPEYHFWLTKEDLPAFVRFEGPLYTGGPVWQITQAVPRLKKD